MAVRIERLTEAAEVLAAAGELLASDPVRTTVTSTVTRRAVGTPAPAHPRWWLVVRVDGEVAGVVMRTAPFAPHPVYTTALPTPAAVAVGQWLHREEPDVVAIDGAAAAGRAIADTLAAGRGRRVAEGERMRLFGLGRLLPPTGVPGRPRPAGAADIDLCTDWLARFDEDAAEQAGRDHRSYDGELSRAEVADRVDEGRIRLWEVDGVAVHLTSFNHPAYGVARVGPVYTPREHRGRGYAAAGVAALSTDLLAGGSRVCLFADDDNPVSTGVYVRLGFEPLELMCRCAIG